MEMEAEQEASSSSIDYDMIQAPQFVDFSALQEADQEEQDPANLFFVPEAITKKIEKVTVPQPFKLHVPRQRPGPSDVKGAPFQFRARPAPIKVLQGAITGLKQKPVVPITLPLTPKFHSEKRIKERQIRENTPLRLPEAKQVPAANGGGDAQPNSGRESVNSSIQSARHRASTTPLRTQSRGRRSASPSVSINKVTVTQPFSFEEREKERKRVKEEKEKLKKQKEEEEKLRREFHANPLPDFKPTLPKWHHKSPTKAAPFHFKLDDREWERGHREALKEKTEKAMLM